MSSTPLDPAPLADVFGRRPAAATRFAEMFDLLWRSDDVDPITVELIRLRVGRLLGCEAETSIRLRVAVDAGLDEALVDALTRWTSDPSITEPQRAALAFAEQYVVDPHGVTDADFVRLHGHWSEPAIATIVLAVAMCDALIRFRLALGVVPDGPEPTVVDGVMT